jgi:hypothetical protein
MSQFSPDSSPNPQLRTRSSSAHTRDLASLSPSEARASPLIQLPSALVSANALPGRLPRSDSRRREQLRLRRYHIPWSSEIYLGICGHINTVRVRSHCRSPIPSLPSMTQHFLDQPLHLPEVPADDAHSPAIQLHLRNIPARLVIRRANMESRTH